MTGEFKVIDRRVSHNETVLGEQVSINTQNVEKMENFRKRIQRLDGQLTNLKRNTTSALENAKEEAASKPSTGL